MNRMSQFLNKTSSLVQAAMASISFFFVSLLLSSLYTIGTLFWLDKGSFGLLPIKVDRLNSPVGWRSLSDAEDGGVGEVEVGLGVVSFSADFLKLIMLFRPSEDTCSLKMWARRLKQKHLVECISDFRVQTANLPRIIEREGHIPVGLGPSTFSSINRQDMCRRGWLPFSRRSKLNHGADVTVVLHIFDGKEKALFNMPLSLRLFRVDDRCHPRSSLWVLLFGIVEFGIRRRGCHALEPNVRCANLEAESFGKALLSQLLELIFIVL